MFIKDNRLNSIRIKAMLVEGGDFEIHRTYTNASILIASSSLYEKWKIDGILYNVDPFKKTRISETDYYYFKSDKQFLLGLVRHGNPFSTRRSATTFSFILKQMRKVTSISLFDGIYIEEFGYILPTYTSDSVSDDALLGTYLSGGQAKHFSDGKINALMLNEADYDEIARIIGIAIAKEEPQEGEKPIKVKGARFSLVGRPELEKFFNEHIVAILDEPERYKKLGIDFPSSIVLFGPPGCGKTYAVDRLVEFLGLPSFEINSASVASPYIHDTSKKISAVFENAAHNAPSIIVIDEMESYLSNRNSTGGSNHHLEEVAEFLRQIQNAQKNKVIIIAMTNMLDSIDPAILRRGRFDHHVEVGLPSVEEIANLIKFLIKKVAAAEDVNPEEIAKKLAGRTLADVTFVMKEAALISGKNGLDKVADASVQEAIKALPKVKEKRKIGFGE